LPAPGGADKIKEQEKEQETEGKDSGKEKRKLWGVNDFHYNLVSLK